MIVYVVIDAYYPGVARSIVAVCLTHDCANKARLMQQFPHEYVIEKYETEEFL